METKTFIRGVPGMAAKARGNTLLTYDNRCMNKPEELPKSFSIRLSVEMLNASRQIAKQHTRSIHGEILTALSEHIKKSQKELDRP